ncbi:MAG: hypothetical protein DI534_14355 [Leifsonia xyli]|nr:MAG: hypothetical protein DI534_14355 [Leifsonia xyli]
MPISELAPFLVLVAVAALAVGGIAVSSARRRRAAASASAAAPAGDVAGAGDAPSDTPPALWGLHVPGTPVQRMARSLAIGFASIDPEETSQLVRSTDGGANWYVVPRERWNEDAE